MFCAYLVPHEDFYKGFWYKSKNNPWYHFKYTEREHINSYTENFYNSVDKDILSLIKLLHSKNIVTTPSCSGHSYSESYYSQLYNKIQLSFQKINNKGLKLINIENGEKLNYHNLEYKFPYTKSDFVRYIQVYGAIGIVGCIGDFSYIKNVEGLNIKYDGYVTNFIASKNNKYIWNYLYNQFLSIPKH